MNYYDEYKVDVPEGTCGDWAVSRFTVTEDEARFFVMRQAFSGGGRGASYMSAGTYTQLTCQGRGIIMSDTPDEIRDHLPPIREAKRRGGHVLVNGLGLGMVAAAILGHENVERVTVVEAAHPVRDLVANHLIRRFGDRFEVVMADAMTWQPPRGQRYTVVWHDIWDAMCEDNLPQMHTLHRRYGRRCDWQGSWGRDLIEYRRRA